MKNQVSEQDLSTDNLRKEIFYTQIPNFIKTATTSAEIAETLIKRFVNPKIKPDLITFEDLFKIINHIKLKEFFTLYCLLRDIYEMNNYPLKLQKVFACFGVDSTSSGIQTVVFVILSAYLACATKMLSPEKLEILAKEQNVEILDLEFFKKDNLYKAFAEEVRTCFQIQLKKKNLKNLRKYYQIMKFQEY